MHLGLKVLGRSAYVFFTLQSYNKWKLRSRLRYAAYRIMLHYADISMLQPAGMPYFTIYCGDFKILFQYQFVIQAT